MAEVRIFQNRDEAGHRLADALQEYSNDEVLVLAVPRGGAPVGYRVAKKLKAVFDVIIPRKIPIPWNPEAGFGAITADGTMVLNERMVQSLDLTDEEIRHAADVIKDEIIRRTERYRGDKPFPDVKGKTVILVDDGLASGYTMLAAIKSLKRKEPSKVVVAVPVASSGAARLVGAKANQLVALIISERLPFAVADFYVEWKDLSDNEVMDYLNKRIES